MKLRGRTIMMVWLRRAFQTLFIGFFLYLFFQTVLVGLDDVQGPVTFFFDIDPFVMVGTWLATYAIPATMFLALITLGVTFLFGRWFCGWICPFGVLHNFFTSLRIRKAKSRIQQGKFSSAQRIKYYILVLALVLSMFGVNAVGWLDPFSFFYRSLATAIYPALNMGAVEFFGWVYDKEPHIGPLYATSATEPIYGLLRDTVIAYKQPVYYSGLFIGSLFLLIVGLNFFRARFWCRYICPLGALLGVVGKNPIMRVVVDENACKGCNLCQTDCQGAANPQKGEPWKPSECFFCYNCEDSCNDDAVKIKIQFFDKEGQS